MSKDGLFNKPPSSDSFWNKNALSYAQQERDDLQEINVDKQSKSNQKKFINLICGHNKVLVMFTLN